MVRPFNYLFTCFGLSAIISRAYSLLAPLLISYIGQRLQSVYFVLSVLIFLACNTTCMLVKTSNIKIFITFLIQKSFYIKKGLYFPQIEYVYFISGYSGDT
jgi:hypothetical protein